MYMYHHDNIELFYNNGVTVYRDYLFEKYGIVQFRFGNVKHKL